MFVFSWVNFQHLDMNQFSNILSLALIIVGDFNSNFHLPFLRFQSVHKECSTLGFLLYNGSSKCSSPHFTNFSNLENTLNSLVLHPLLFCFFIPKFGHNLSFGLLQPQSSLLAAYFKLGFAARPDSWTAKFMFKIWIQSLCIHGILAIFISFELIVGRLFKLHGKE